jgi:hypothetical protein
MDEKSIFVFCSKNQKQIKMIYIEWEIKRRWR